MRGTKGLVGRVGIEAEEYVLLVVPVDDGICSGSSTIAVTGTVCGQRSVSCA